MDEDFKYRISVGEIAKAVAGAIVVQIPNEWFTRIPKDGLVYDAFYRYVAEKSKIEKAASGLGVYAGSGLYDKLFSLMRKATAKILRLSGEKLERATRRSSFMSAPLTCISMETEIVGVDAVVIPDGSDDALFGLHMKKVMQSNRRIARQADGSTFVEWLLCQTDRDDWIGDLARDAKNDEEFVVQSATYEKLAEYLEEVARCDGVIDAAFAAFREYSQYSNRMGKPHANTPTIYFIQTDRADCVKIGYTSSLASRFRAYATHSSVEPRLLFSFPGDKQTERELHQRFEHLRIAGKREWFRLGDEILAYIDTLRDNRS